MSTVEKTNHKLYLKKIFIILGLSFWPLFFLFISGQSVSTLDTYTHYLPLRFNAVHTMLDGSLPLWNPYTQSGNSLIGDGISNPFDILNIVFVFFDPVIAGSILYSLQLFLSGFFMYIYMRKSLPFKDLSSLLGAILYIFNPVLIFGVGQRLDFVNPLGTFLWLPLIMLFIDKSIERDKLYFYGVRTGIIVAFSVFCGSINLVFFMAVYFSIYILSRQNAFKKKIILITIIGIVSIFISSVQVLPILEISGKGHRTLLWDSSNIEYSGSNIWAVLVSAFQYPVDIFLYKRDFLSSTLSSIFKTNIVPYYIGILDLFLLMLVYISKIENFKIRFYKIVTILLLAFNISIYYLPIKGIIANIFPIFRGIKFSYITFLFYFSVIVLITYAFDNIVFYKNSKLKNFKKLYNYKAIGFILTFSFLIIGIVRLNALGTIKPSFHELRIVLYIFLLGGSFYFLCKIAQKENIKFAKLLIVMMTFNMFLVWEYNFVRFIKSDRFHAQFKQSEELLFFKNIKPTERFEIFDGTPVYYGNYLFGFNSALFHRVSIAGGSSQFTSKRQRKLFDMINGRYPFDNSYYWKNGKYVYPSAYTYLDNKTINFNTLNLLGVKYILSKTERNEKFLKKIGQGKIFNIYENLNVLPRCFIVHEYELLDSDQILEKLHTNSFNPLNRVLLEKEPSSEVLTSNLSAGSLIDEVKCEIIKYDYNKVLIKTKSNRDGYLVFTDTFDKGWKVFIDDTKGEILQANYLFRGVKIPEGEHIVRFDYLPMSFVYGSLISTITICFILIFSLNFYFRSIYQRFFEKK